MQENRRKIKVTALIGSARKGHSYAAAKDFLAELQRFGIIEYEIVRLNEYNLKVCQGCKLCCDRGEELCPLKDDRDIIIQKMDESDGIIFAAPNYSFHVSGLMKIFLDRLGFLFHRPRFFGKTSTAIISQGVFGASTILKYFDFIGNALGCNSVKGTSLTTLEPISEKQRAKNYTNIEKAALRFYSKLQKKEMKKPSLFEVIIFRISRSSIQNKLDESFRDFTYFRDKGWFNSDYFYPVKLGPVKKMAGIITDSFAKKRKSNTGEF